MFLMEKYTMINFNIVLIYYYVEGVCRHNQGKLVELLLSSITKWMNEFVLIDKLYLALVRLFSKHCFN